MKTISEFILAKQKQEKISMVTCYDFTSAQIIKNTNVDAVLIGDSAAMTMHGYPNAVCAIMDQMVLHTSAVTKVIKTKLVIAYLPFLSYRSGFANTLLSVKRLMQAVLPHINLVGW